jgi:5-methylcytosine-specific restriction endonuclease McrA
MARQYRKPKYKKPRRGAAKTIEAKARSMQSSWRKATNQTGTLTIKDAKKIIENPPTCPYCKQVIHWRELSIDHAMPRSRDGACDPSNLVWAHRSCNLAKGNLNAVEFTLLMEFLNQHPSLKDSVLLRLRAGGAILKGRTFTK